MKTAAAILLVSLSIAPAAAQEPPANIINKMMGLTVLEAINIGAALRMMGDHPEVGPEGRPTGKTSVSALKFDGGVLMAMAINIAESDKAQKAAQETSRVLFARFAKDIKNESGVIERKVPPEKMQEYQAEYEKALDVQAAVSMVRIKESDLCLPQKPVPPCAVTNVVPPAYLAALLKIIDR